MPFSNFGGKISCVRGISFFAIRIFGWIQTTLNMLGHMAGRRMERQVSGTLKRNCRGTEQDKQTLGRKISCGVHCVCVCVEGRADFLGFFCCGIFSTSGYLPLLRCSCILGRTALCSRGMTESGTERGWQASLYFCSWWASAEQHRFGPGRSDCAIILDCGCLAK